MGNPEKQASGKPIPVIRANNEAVTTALGLIAALQEMKVALDSRFLQRFKAVPNGYRNARLIFSLLNKLIDDVLLTFPVEKLESMQRMLPHMKFQIHCGPSVSKINNDEVIISEKNLDALVLAAHDGKCKLCIDQNCKRCKLGKALDGLCCYDREDGSWATIDIEREIKE